MNADSLRTEIARPILVVTTGRYPWPLDHGFANKNYWMIRLLSRDFRIRFHPVCYGKVDAEAINALRPFCETISVHRPGWFSCAWALLACLWNGQPFQLAIFQSIAARRAIRADLAVASAAISSGARTSPYVMQTEFRGARFMDLGDSLGQIYATNSRHIGSWVRRAVYRTEGQRMLAWEQRLVAECDDTFLFNPVEVENLSRFGAVRVVPHGVPPRLFESDATTAEFADGVVVFGKMDYPPNVDSAFWFAEHVLPLLPASIRLYVVGSHPSPRLHALAAENPRVVVKGFMDDPYPGLRGAIASVCPVRMGGGIQNKVLESLAIGAYTLISPLAAVPLDDIESSGMVVCDSPQQWAQVIAAASAEPARNLAARQAGRAYAKARFSWEAYADVLLGSVQAGIARRKPAPHASPQ